MSRSPTALLLVATLLVGCDARPPGHRGRSINNLHNLGIAVHSHAGANDDLLPRGTLRDDQGRALHGWTVQLLDGLDASAIRRQVDFEVAWDDPRNEEPMTTVLPVLLHPGADWTDDRGYALTSYAANSRVIGDFDPVTFDAIAAGDGIATTLLLGEVGSAPRPWGHPANHRDPASGFGTRPTQFGSPVGDNSIHVMMADGAARSLSTKIDPAVLRALGTPDGGEEIDEADIR